MLVRSGAVDVIVVDSVAALVPKAELDGDMGDSHMGLQARLMSQALRKLTGSITKSNTSVIFINQLRPRKIFSSPSLIHFRFTLIFQYFVIIIVLVISPVILF